MHAVVNAPAHVARIALDLDGTLLGLDGQVSPRTRAALHAAEAAGIHLALATGRRHGYAMRVLGGLGLGARTVLVSSNGAVVRRLDSSPIERTLMPLADARWLLAALGAFRDALVITFDRVLPSGEDAADTLVVEDLQVLHGSIDRWMLANAPYIRHVHPLEDALGDDGDPPIQMMVAGPVARMRHAEAVLLALEGIDRAGQETAATRITLNRTEYPERDLSIVDILPAGCGKGPALGRLAALDGVGLDRLMAIGDNWNDLSMLELAACPVLMGNAPAELLLHARTRGWQVTAGHAEDGVALAIEAVLAARSSPAPAEPMSEADQVLLDV